MPVAHVNGIDLYYRLHGRGRPLVLLTGLGGGHGAWFFQLRAFRRHHRLIAIDNRGIGRSTKPAETYTVSTMAEDTVGLLDHLNIDRADVLGVSMGGMIAQKIAIDYPQRVDRLVLACTTAVAAGIGVHPPETAGAAAGSVDPGEGEAAAVDSGTLMSGVNFLAINGRVCRLLLTPLIGLYMRRVGLDGVAGQLAAVRAHNTLDSLHLIEAPTLVMAGTNDRLIPPESSELIASRIPNARLVMVEGGSHLLPVEKRGRFNREVLAFLGDG